MTDTDQVDRLLAERNALREQRDELLTALREATEGLEYLRCAIADQDIQCSREFAERWDGARAAARAAIAKCEAAK